MQYRTLGRTGFNVSTLGLGCGGPSRLGQRTGCDADHSVRLVQLAIDLGINFIDTAQEYNTEPIVGQAIASHQRDNLVIATKVAPRQHNRLIGPDELTDALEQSLTQLRTDRIDLYQLHGVLPQDYHHAREHLVPAMLQARQQGKIRALGITEEFNHDLTHRMLQQALADDCWDVMMVGFNILNQTARATVLQPARDKNIGILDMFAVRNDLHQPDKLRRTMAALIREGQVDPADIDPDSPLDFLVRPDAATSIPDAAYRFCRDEPGVHVVLFGTARPEHLKLNVKSINRPPLPQADRDRLVQLFANVDSVTGQ